MKRSLLLFLLISITLFVNAQTKATIYFDSNKSELNPNTTKTLDSLAAAVRTEDIYQVVINGYCDNTGDYDFNLVLSKDRAKAVADYFKPKIISGLDAKGLGVSLTGNGEREPVASNDNESGKAKNRRVEVEINVSRPFVRDTSSATIIIPENKKTFNEKSTLTGLEVGKTLVLKNLNFEGGTAVLLPEAKPTLEMLLRTMQDNPTLVIEIGGHVCCKNDMPLSIQRAESVYSYLIKNGINKDRMTYKGYSRLKPIFEDDSDEYHARINRRVEITILKK